MADLNSMIITSIPLHSKARTADGMSYLDYQGACIESWRKVCRNIVSVNCVQESARSNHSPYEYSRKEVYRDSIRYCGKPLVRLQDILAAAQSCHNESVVILNSDIYIHDPLEVRKIIHLLRPGEAIVGRRLNIQSIELAQAMVYRLGFDIFIFHSSDIGKLFQCSSDLHFGDPWWDYVMLSNCILSGMHVSSMNPINALHLWHEPAFSKERWASIGFNEIQNIKNLLETVDRTRATDAALKLADIANIAHLEIIDLLRSLTVGNMRVEIGLTADEKHVKPLRDFSHGLVSLAEELIGCQPSIHDPSSVDEACRDLLAALSRATNMERD